MLYSWNLFTLKDIFFLVKHFNIYVVLNLDHDNTDSIFFIYNLNNIKLYFHFLYFICYIKPFT